MSSTLGFSTINEDSQNNKQENNNLERINFALDNIDNYFTQ